MSKLSNYSEQAYALLRIFAALFFLQHGLQKLIGFPVEFPFPMNPMIWAAGIIETVGGIMIAVGFMTRPAAFIASGMSAAAYWMAHGFNGFFPIANGGELVALYCFIFLFIATRGAGIWSVDGADK